MHPSLLRIVLGCVLLSGLGCRTYMPYVGRQLESTTEARNVIYQLLDQQPGSNAAIEVEVTDEKIRLLRSRSNAFLGTSGINGTTIYYSAIGGIRLSKKGNWYAITIDGKNGVALLHVYAADALVAERFIDALETMRQAAPPPA
jgi:hypothetical protein